MKRENRRWKDMLLGGVVTLLISCMIVPALAYSGTRNETLSFSNIKVTLDGTTLRCGTVPARRWSLSSLTAPPTCPFGPLPRPWA